MVLKKNILIYTAVTDIMIISMDMVPSTGYLKIFELKSTTDLCWDIRKSRTQLPGLGAEALIFREFGKWGKFLSWRISVMNDAIKNGRINEVIQGLHEKIAQMRI